MIDTSIPRLSSYRDFVELRLCMALHRHCVGRQFTHVTELDFANLLNLRSTSIQVHVRTKEKLRVCFLISKLSALIEDETAREQWYQGILDTLVIAPSYYKSHYCDAASEGTGKKNKNFVQTMKSVFLQLDLPF